MPNGPQPLQYCHRWQQQWRCRRCWRTFWSQVDPANLRVLLKHLAQLLWLLHQVQNPGRRCAPCSGAKAGMQVHAGTAHRCSWLLRMHASLEKPKLTRCGGILLIYTIPRLSYFFFSFASFFSDKSGSFGTLAIFAPRAGDSAAAAASPSLMNWPGCAIELKKGTGEQDGHQAGLD